MLILDLCAGLKGASQAMKERGVQRYQHKGRVLHEKQRQAR